MAVDLQPPYRPSIGVSKLLVVRPLGTDKPSRGAEVGAAAALERIVVRLSLSPTAPKLKLNSLAQWKSAGPFASEL
jgi:hypothetical protein